MKRWILGIVASAALLLSTHSSSTVLEVEILSELHRVSGAVLNEDEPDLLETFDTISRSPVTNDATNEHNHAAASTGAFSVSATGWMHGAAFAASRYLFRPVEKGGITLEGSALIGDPITRGDFYYRLTRVIDTNHIIGDQAPTCGYTGSEFKECESLSRTQKSDEELERNEVYQIDMIAASERYLRPEGDPFDAPGVGLHFGYTSPKGAVNASLVSVPNPQTISLLIFSLLLLGALRLVGTAITSNFQEP